MSETNNVGLCETCKNGKIADPFCDIKCLALCRHVYDQPEKCEKYEKKTEKNEEK